MGSRDQDDVRVDRVRRSQNADPAEPVSETASVSPAVAIEATTSVDAVTATDAIVAALASGAIAASEARRRLIDVAVRAQLPADSDPKIVDAVRNELESLLADDPTLAALLGR